MSEIPRGKSESEILLSEFLVLVKIKTKYKKEAKICHVKSL